MKGEVKRFLDSRIFWWHSTTDRYPINVMLEAWAEGNSIYMNSSFEQKFLYCDRMIEIQRGDYARRIKAI